MIELSNKIKALIIGAAFLLVAIIVAVVVLLVGQSSRVVKVQSISFDVANQQMMVGEQKELVVTVYPNNAKDKDVLFASSNENVLKIVANNGNSVLIEAISIGNAVVNVTSKTNKKVLDSCNVQVLDNVATDIIVENDIVEEYVGRIVEIPILLQPESSNYQKLAVESYDENIIYDPQIVVDDNGAKLVFQSSNAGSCDIVLSFLAEHNSIESPVLFKQLHFTAKTSEISDLTFLVWGSSQQSYSRQVNNFLIGANDEYRFKIQCEDLNGGIITTSDIVPVYDSEIFDIRIDGLEYIVKLKAGAADWEYSNIVFDYKGKQLVLNFVYIETWPTDFSVSIHNVSQTAGVYRLNSECSYVIELSDNVKKLIKFGFAHLELDREYDEITLSNLILSCASSMNSSSVGFVLKFDYWNAVSSYDITENININISDKDYDE